MVKRYSLQVDSHHNAIICGDTRERRGYSVTAVGTYQDMIIARAVYRCTGDMHEAARASQPIHERGI